MATQGIKVYITGMTGFLIIRYAEVATPTAYIAQTDARPFPVDETYVISNLRRVAHYFEFWQSNDGTTFNQQIKVWEIDVSKQEQPVIENYYYTVDGGAPTDPASGQGALRDARLQDKTYVVFEKGTGHLNPVTDYTDRSDDGGGFDLAEGYTFNSPGSYLVEVQDTVTVDRPETGGPTIAGGFTEVILASEDADTLTADFYGKLIESAYGTGNTGVFNMQPLASIPDGTVLRFSTHLGNQIYLKIQFSGSETIRFWNRDRNHIYLGKCEALDILKTTVDGTPKFFPMNDRTGYARVGQRIWGDTTEINTYLRDGTIYGPSFAGRLIDWINERFTTAQLRSFAEWDTQVNGVKVYSHQFAFDSPTGRVRLPDSMNMYQRAITSGVQPGSYQGDMAKAEVEIWTGQGGDGGSTATNVGYVGQNPNVLQFRKKTAAQTATETRVKSELLLPLIRI